MEENGAYRPFIANPQNLSVGVDSNLCVFCPPFLSPGFNH